VSPAKSPFLKKRRSAGKIEALSAILPSVGERLKLDQKVKEWSTLALWETVIDEPFKGCTKAVAIQKRKQLTTLVVTAQHATVAAQLYFYLPQYQERLNTYASQTGIVIDRIQCRSSRPI
jgi:hypothetical protein